MICLTKSRGCSARVSLPRMNCLLPRDLKAEPNEQQLVDEGNLGPKGMLLIPWLRKVVFV